MHKNWLKYLIFFVFLCLAVVLYFFNLHREISLETIHQKGDLLKAYVNNHPIISPLVFICFYILSVCLIIPDSSILTLLAGFIFPYPLALFYSIFAETMGAFTFFLIFQTLFKYEKHSYFNKMQKAFNANPASYLLFLRVSHLIPFWITTLGAAYFKVRPWTLLWTTFIGIIPFSTLLVQAGHNFSKVLAKNEQLSLDGIFTLQIKICLILLGILALTPILIKKILRRKKWRWKL